MSSSIIVIFAIKALKLSCVRQKPGRPCFAKPLPLKIALSMDKSSPLLV